MKYNAHEFVQKIPNCYVSDDGVQIMIAHFGDTMSILNSDGLVYYNSPNSNIYINNYFNDPRRCKFPFSDIPTHTERIKFKKVEFVNQILDFDTTYITIADNIIREFYAVKDRNDALVATKTIVPNHKTIKTFSLDDFDNWLKTFNIGIFNPNGFKESMTIPIEERILDVYKEHLISSDIDHLTEEDDVNFALISTLTTMDIPSVYTFNLFKPGIFISTNKNKGQNMIDIKCGYAIFENYKVYLTIADCPVTQYNYEYLKYLEQTSLANTPKPKIRTKKI